AIASDASSNDDHHQQQLHQLHQLQQHAKCSATHLHAAAHGSSDELMAKLHRWEQHGSIPRRVKKLTWEDERLGGYAVALGGATSGFGNVYSSNNNNNNNACLGKQNLSCELDPDVSVAPLRA